MIKYHLIVYGTDAIIAALLVFWMSRPLKGRHER